MKSPHFGRVRCAGARPGDWGWADECPGGPRLPRDLAPRTPIRFISHDIQTTVETADGRRYTLCIPLTDFGVYYTLEDGREYHESTPQALDFLEGLFRERERRLAMLRADPDQSRRCMELRDTEESYDNMGWRLTRNGRDVGWVPVR